VQHAAFDPPPPPPPDRPELPEGAAPRWPAWYAGVGFLVALIATLIVVGILAAATGATADDEDPTFTIVATFLQGLIFIGTAVLFASLTRKPKPEQFGLRPARFWPAAGWAALGMLTFYALVALYSVIVQPDAEQSVAQDLGADQGTFGMIAAGFMVICVAPIAEEFFFRGFFFGALRNWRGMLPAAIITGLVFGAIHVGSAQVAFLLPLAFFGFVLCLIRAKTGSLYPCMALHCANNSLAFGVSQHWSWQIPILFVGSLAVITLTVLVVRTAWTPAAAPAPAT
jgi:hypothetical protein